MLALDLRHTPLILAIESDQDQVSWLTSAVRRRGKAELLFVRTVEEAIKSIDTRVPDLVLVPALLSPRDEGALLEAVRANAAAAHVQMLTIPVLVPPESQAASRGFLGRFRREKTSDVPAGTQGSSFAEQIAATLKRAVEARSAAEARATVDESSASDAAAGHFVPAVEPEPSSLESESDIVLELPFGQIAGDLALTFDTAGAPAWPELFEPLREADGMSGSVGSALKLKRRAAKSAGRVARPRAVQEAWAGLDPLQCGFTTLLARLREVTAREEPAGGSAISG